MNAFPFKYEHLDAEPANARERSRLETRRRLMVHGLELFANKGVANTRASDVAEAAGVAVGTLYVHFGDKRGLLREILFAGIEELLEPLHRLAANLPDDLTDAVRRHTTLMVDFAQERQDFCRVLFDPESARLSVSPEIFEYLVGMHERRLREGLDRGIFPADLDARVAAYGAVGMLVNVLNWWTHNPEATQRETIIDTLTRLRVSGVYQV